MIEYIIFFTFAFLLGVFILGKNRTLLASSVFIIVVIITALGLLEMQARPKPIGAEWRSAESAEVFWYTMREGESITLLLDVGGPRLYILPWNKKKAEQLLRAGQEAAVGAGKIMMRNPFEPSLDQDSEVFHSPPQPAPPLKTR